MKYSLEVPQSFHWDLEWYCKWVLLTPRLLALSIVTHLFLWLNFSWVKLSSVLCGIELFCRKPLIVLLNEALLFYFLFFSFFFFFFFFFLRNCWFLVFLTLMLRIGRETLNIHLVMKRIPLSLRCVCVCSHVCYVCKNKVTHLDEFFRCFFS